MFVDVDAPVLDMPEVEDQVQIGANLQPLMVPLQVYESTVYSLVCLQLRNTRVVIMRFSHYQKFAR